MPPDRDHWLVYVQDEWDASFEDEVAAREHAEWMVTGGGYASIYRRRGNNGPEEFIEDVGLRPLVLPVRARLSSLSQS